MSAKAMRLIPIYWGKWWVPAEHNTYNWPEVNGQIQTIVSGRYMDGLNQYGIARGSVERTYVHQIDPPAEGFTDYNTGWLFKMAIDDGHVPLPDDFDLATDQPFYCLIVKPGIEHLRDPDLAPETKLGGYHFGFSYDYGDGREPWDGQACWIKATADLDGTVRRWVHEMAEAYSYGAGEISDTCEKKQPVIVDGVSVPQYWSNADNGCWPPSDLMEEAGREPSKEEATRAGTPLGDERMTTVERGRTHR
jgi:hypothetical protein